MSFSREAPGFSHGECHELTLHVHASALIEPRRPGQILRVHVQPHGTLAAAMERAEGMEQQRLAQPAAAPGTPHAERLHHALGFPRGVAEHDAGDRLALHGQEPEARVEIASAQPPLDPVLEVAGYMTEVVLEGLVARREGWPLVLAAPERAHPDPRGPCWPRCPPRQPHPHPP